MNQRDNGFGCRAGTLATLGPAAGSRDLPRTACKQVVTVEKHFVSDSKKKNKTGISLQIEESVGAGKQLVPGYPERGTEQGSLT